MRQSETMVDVEIKIDDHEGKIMLSEEHKDVACLAYIRAKLNCSLATAFSAACDSIKHGNKESYMSVQAITRVASDPVKHMVLGHRQSLSENTMLFLRLFGIAILCASKREMKSLLVPIILQSKNEFNKKALDLFKGAAFLDISSYSLPSATTSSGSTTKRPHPQSEDEADADDFADLDGSPDHPTPRRSIEYKQPLVTTRFTDQNLTEMGGLEVLGHAWETYDGDQEAFWLMRMKQWLDFKRMFRSVENDDIDHRRRLAEAQQVECKVTETKAATAILVLKLEVDKTAAADDQAIRAKKLEDVKSAAEDGKAIRAEKLNILAANLAGDQKKLADEQEIRAVHLVAAKTTAAADIENNKAEQQRLNDGQKSEQQRLNDGQKSEQKRLDDDAAHRRGLEMAQVTRASQVPQSDQAPPLHCNRGKCKNAVDYGYKMCTMHRAQANARVKKARMAKACEAE
jgi:hypothetical protein